MVDVGDGISLLSQGTGYGMIIGLGILFALIILAAVKIQKLYLMEDSGKSEMFMVANRSVGTGLTCSAVFSSWMWINETVFACVYCYEYGIAVPMWWGVGLSFQIALMAVLGVLAKIRVPYAHTSLEIIRRRYGNLGHFVFTVLNLINNIFGCSSMILAGSQLVTGITGMHLAAATILLPFGVVLYTAVGGLKATFLTDFLHTTIALILIIYFTLSVLANEHIGGLHGLYDKLMAKAGTYYIDGNYAGSLLTFKSKGAMMFGLILKFGNLALVTMDTAFWQKSFASEVHSTVPGYDLAALAIFAVPWGLGTVIGLSARVVNDLPIFPTYPKSLNASEINSGMVMPYTVKALLGNGATVGILLLLFMAVTSTVSSSMIAVSSIISFDVYRTYINPKATDRQVVRVSHLGVVFHGIFIAGFALALNYGGANMNWINYFSPILTCPGIFPLMMTLFWSGQTRLAAIVSPILGLITGVSIWLGTAYSLYGKISIDTTSAQAPSLYGSVGSLFSPILYSVIISYIRPQTFDWREFLRINLVEDESETEISTPAESETPHSSQSVVVLNEAQTEKGERAEKAAHQEPRTRRVTKTNNAAATTGSLDHVVHPFDEATLRYLRKWLHIAVGVLIFIVLITFVVWPMPLYRDYIFTRSFFTGWTTVAIIWQFFALFAVVIYPVWDGRHAIAKSVRGLVSNLRK
ncbi:hypothetical protein VTN96DRAFT_247 [Rasamsonia emersonii]|uniref:SSS family solute:Na+ symporter n=1 Tax=Rasamsonia emersonii (strain ATCC 16479 / CBS 393.64 / IMI 116815) TaxID=1408163 RepID=A0A0F4YRU5_RASE3|nr:SSS family solute:Na+ symporter [Rasamsonia emersonii CBS 393.64]KKA20805.1 SSS family solute:Na+ symporter [Rasamsonia emersonii CBS 393.64]